MAGRPSANSIKRAQGRRLGARVRRLREARRWSREHLAAVASIPARTLERIECEGTANPGFFTVAALAEALDVQLGVLLQAARGTADAGVVSVGYEGRTIDGFVEALAERDVRTVADVRLTPISRKPGFSKTRLSGALSEAGIAYRHLRALGNPKDNRPPFWNGRAEEGRMVFQQLLTADPGARQLDELLALAADQTVAVLCFEQDEERCHRKVICDIARDGHGLTVTALD
ncbi:DUF488 family protein [Streptomyces sp. Inha503]|uniref:DUF488 family protein, N3 subclade n=1 Tax=Streptomyces sp. Inha503 TaxID=3383314 RepID=UPI0039A281A8